MTAYGSDRGRPSAQDTGSATGQDALARRLSDVARELEDSDDPAATLAEVVQAAIAVIPGVEHASISAVHDRRTVISEAPSSELARTVDAIQDEVGEGPCLDAVYEQQTVRVTDMRTEERWPRFARRAGEAGAASMLAFQLYVEGDNLGALNLYAGTPGAFDDESEHVGLLFAAHAAVAYAGVRKQSQLVRAVASRELIGQATGILMERYKIPGDQGFRLLVRTSQRQNVKLRELAGRLVHTGQLPGTPSRPSTAGQERGIIVAGALYVDAGARDRYLAATADVARQARTAPGCLDFVQSADPLDPERVNIHERWESDQDLHRFRNSGGPDVDLPELRSADVHKYRISAVEQP